MPVVSREVAMSALWEVMRTPVEEGSRVAVVHGPPGVGKTHLVERFAREARATGAVVRQATGTQTGQDVPLGLVDQLFGDDESVRNAATARAHSCAPSAARLCTPCQSLASRAQPLIERFLRSAAGASRMVLVVDDPHFADSVSLWVLRSLLARVRNLPVLLVVSGVRLSPTRQFRDFQFAITKHSSLLEIGLSPFTFSEGTRLLRDMTGIRPSAAFMKKVMELTGGNARLLAAVGWDRKTLPYLGDPSEPLKHGELHCRISFTVRLLLGSGLVDGLERVARALAVVDTDGSQALISALSGVGAVETASALELMDAMGLMAGGVFRHPAIRAAVLEDSDFTDRVEFHRSAARLLHRQGAPVCAVARCLGTAGVAAQPWERAVLREAARQAKFEGRWAVAVRCLQLAYDFASGTGEQAEVLMELACATWRVDVSAALSHLLELVDHARQGRLPSQSVVAVSEMLAWGGHRAVAKEILDLLSDRDREELDRARDLLEFPALDRPPGTPHAAGPVDPWWGDAYACPTERVEAFGASKEMIRSYFLDADQMNWVMDVGYFTARLLHHVCFSLPDMTFDGLAEEGRDTMSPFRHLILHCLRSVNALNGGRPAEAEQEARSALADPADWGIYVGLPLSVLILAQVRQGRFEEAKATLRTPVPDNLFASEFGRLYLHARGLYRLSTGTPSSALGDFLRCGEIERRLGVPASPACPWQAHAGEAYLQLRRKDDAVRTAEAVVVESGPPWGRAIALRVLALARPIDLRADLLRDMVGLLEDSPHRVDLAMGLYDLGRTHHALGNTKVGRALVRRAWNMARYSGFEPLMRVLSSPVPGDPTAPAFGGPDLADDFWEEPEGTLSTDVLSSAERRVAWLAGIGHSNREIADRLCITVSTVEQHLTKIYRKLGLKQRDDLLMAFPIPPDGMIP